jgi:hypothetical protein
VALLKGSPRRTAQQDIVTKHRGMISREQGMSMGKSFMIGIPGEGSTHKPSGIKNLNCSRTAGLLKFIIVFPKYLTATLKKSFDDAEPMRWAMGFKGLSVG